MTEEEEFDSRVGEAVAKMLSEWFECWAMISYDHEGKRWRFQHAQSNVQGDALATGLKDLLKEYDPVGVWIKGDSS